MNWLYTYANLLRCFYYSNTSRYKSRCSHVLTPAVDEHPWVDVSMLDHSHSVEMSCITNEKSCLRTMCVDNSNLIWADGNNAPRYLILLIFNTAHNKNERKECKNGSGKNHNIQDCCVRVVWWGSIFRRGWHNNFSIRRDGSFVAFTLFCSMTTILLLKDFVL